MNNICSINFGGGFFASLFPMTFLNEKNKNNYLRKTLIFKKNQLSKMCNKVRIFKIPMRRVNCDLGPHLFGFIYGRQYRATRICESLGLLCVLVPDSVMAGRCNDGA